LNGKKNKWINLSYANIATTAEVAHKENLKWANSLAVCGAAEFDANSEKNAMMPLRKSTASLLNCEISDICVGSSATELICSIAWALAPKNGCNIVSTQASFPSTVYPWTRVSMEFDSEIRLAPYDENNYTNPNDILKLIDKNTSILTLSHVEYSSGQRYDLNLFANAAHDVGALIVIDATQSMGVFPIDVHESELDFIVASGYKWMRGTFGAAVAYINPKLHSSLMPGLLGFRSHSDMWDMQAKRFELSLDASRFEFSTINFGAALGLAKSIDEINQIGIKNVWQNSIKLTDIIINECNKSNLTIISPLNDLERSGIICIQIPDDFDSKEVVRNLQEDYGILVTSRSGYIRISPHMDNTPDQIFYFINSLKKVLQLK